MAETKFALTLSDLKFPVDLSHNKANFRLVLDIRYFNSRNQPLEKSFIMPGLEEFWECDPGKSENANYVRGVDSPKRAKTLGWVDVGVIDEWDRSSLITAGELHSIRVTLYDVDRRSMWEKVMEKFSSIMENITGKVAGLLPGPFGISSAIESLLVEKLVAGDHAQDQILFRKSHLLVGNDSLQNGKIKIEGDGVPGKKKQKQYVIQFEFIKL